ncbi:MAG: hypothetical protein IPK04_08300 [Bdellovibrionales bacterium]|nr:hypothetical protein [Bdellovibrionales bacterium]
MKTSQIFGVFGFGFLLVMTTLVQTGCTANVTAPAVSPVGGPDGPKQLGNLNGTWETGCTHDAIVQNGDGSGTIEILGESYKFTMNFFEDEVCTKSMLSVTEEGTFKILGPSTALSGAYEIEFLIQKRSHFPDEAPHSEYGLILIENGAMYFSDSRSLISENPPDTVERKYFYKLK